MIIVGVDPGFAHLGISVVELERVSTRVLHHSTFTTSPKDGSDEDRLDSISEHLLDVIEQYDPAAVGYENQAIVEAGKRQRGVPTTFSSGRVHEVTGLIRCAARCYNLPCYCIAPNSVKVAVLGKGGGRADKEAVKRAVRMIFHVQCSEHAADAIAIGVATGVRHRKRLVTLSEHAALIH